MLRLSQPSTAPEAEVFRVTSIDRVRSRFHDPTSCDYARRAGVILDATGDQQTEIQWRPQPNTRPPPRPLAAEAATELARTNTAAAIKATLAQAQATLATAGRVTAGSPATHLGCTTPVGPRSRVCHSFVAPGRFYPTGACCVPSSLLGFGVVDRSVYSGPSLGGAQTVVGDET